MRRIRWSFWSQDSAELVRNCYQRTQDALGMAAWEHTSGGAAFGGLSKAAAFGISATPDGDSPARADGLFWGSLHWCIQRANLPRGESISCRNFGSEGRKKFSEDPPLLHPACIQERISGRKVRLRSTKTHLAQHNPPVTSLCKTRIISPWTSFIPFQQPIWILSALFIQALRPIYSFCTLVFNSCF